MKNKIISVIATIILITSPLSGLNAQQEAAGGISAGTAVAIGIVGAALLVALSDSSSSAAAGIAPAGTSTTTTLAASTTTTTVAASTTTTN
jgi:hypothetical protein